MADILTTCLISKKPKSKAATNVGVASIQCNMLNAQKIAFSSAIVSMAKTLWLVIRRSIENLINQNFSPQPDVRKAKVFNFLVLKTV